MPPPAVLVFVMTGCPACHEFVPRLKAVSAPLRAQGVPVQVVDITKDPRGAQLANQLGVKATPTTIVRSRRGQHRRRVGALADPDLVRLLASAAR